MSSSPISPREFLPLSRWIAGPVTVTPTPTRRGSADSHNAAAPTIPLGQPSPDVCVAANVRLHNKLHSFQERVAWLMSLQVRTGVGLGGANGKATRTVHDSTNVTDTSISNGASRRKSSSSANTFVGMGHVGDLVLGVLSPMHPEDPPVPVRILADSLIGADSVTAVTSPTSSSSTASSSIAVTRLMYATWKRPLLVIAPLGHRDSLTAPQGIVADSDVDECGNGPDKLTMRRGMQLAWLGAESGIVGRLLADVRAASSHSTSYIQSQSGSDSEALSQLPTSSGHPSSNGRAACFDLIGPLYDPSAHKPINIRMLKPTMPPHVLSSMPMTTVTATPKSATSHHHHHSPRLILVASTGCGMNNTSLACNIIQALHVHHYLNGKVDANGPSNEAPAPTCTRQPLHIAYARCTGTGCAATLNRVRSIRIPDGCGSWSGRPAVVRAMDSADIGMVSTYAPPSTGLQAVSESNASKMAAAVAQQAEEFRQSMHELFALAGAPIQTTPSASTSALTNASPLLSSSPPSSSSPLSVTPIDFIVCELGADLIFAHNPLLLRMRSATSRLLALVVSCSDALSLLGTCNFLHSTLKLPPQSIMLCAGAGLPSSNEVYDHQRSTPDSGSQSHAEDAHAAGMRSRVAGSDVRIYDRNHVDEIVRSIMQRYVGTKKPTATSQAAAQVAPHSLNSSVQPLASPVSMQSPATIAPTQLVHAIPVTSLPRVSSAHMRSRSISKAGNIAAGTSSLSSSAASSACHTPTSQGRRTPLGQSVTVSNGVVALPLGTNVAAASVATSSGSTSLSPSPVSLATLSPAIQALFQTHFTPLHFPPLDPPPLTPILRKLCVTLLVWLRSGMGASQTDSNNNTTSWVAPVTEDFVMTDVMQHRILKLLLDVPRRLTASQSPSTLPPTQSQSNGTSVDACARTLQHALHWLFLQRKRDRLRSKLERQAKQAEQEGLAASLNMLASSKSRSLFSTPSTPSRSMLSNSTADSNARSSLLDLPDYRSSPCYFPPAPPLPHSDSMNGSVSPVSTSPSPSPSPILDIDLDASTVPAALLDLDPDGLARLRHQHVPGRVSEDVFWTVTLDAIYYTLAEAGVDGAGRCMMR